MPENDEETGLGYIVPKWVEDVPKGIDPAITTIILPLDKPGFGHAAIEEMLQDIEPETILFLSKLKEIKIETDTGDALAILKDDVTVPHVQILIEGKKQGESFSKLSEFLLYSKFFDKPIEITHEKRIGIDQRDVSIAFPLGEDEESAGRIFAYLPVRSDTGLPFLINADFILTSSREEVREDEHWNRWLMDCVAELVGDALCQLRERGLLTIHLLDALTGRIKDVSEKSILYPIAHSVTDAFNNEELLPTDDETFVKAKCAKLARGLELRSLLDQDQLSLLFQSPHVLNWLSAEITPNLRLYLMEQLKIEEVRPEKFVELLTDDFLEKQDDKWIINFYSFLGKDRTYLWKKPDATLKKKKIIRLTDNSHVTPFKSDGTPNAYLPSTANTSFPTVKRTIFEVEPAADFLKQLDIIPPDLFAEIIEFILPKYAENKTIADLTENISDLKKIKKVLSEPYQGDSESTISKLRILLVKLGLSQLEDSFSSMDEPGKLIPALMQHLVLPSIRILKASNGSATAYSAPKDIYENNDELRHYFLENNEAWFICNDYPDELLSMLREIGVNDSPRVTKKNPYDNGFIKICSSHGCHRRGLKRFDPDIKVEGLSIALSFPTPEKSLFIWNKIVLPNADCIRGTIEKSSRQTYENSSKEERISESFGRLLIESAWLPRADGHFLCPAEISLNELPEQFERSEKLADLLGMKKDIFAKLAEEAGINQETIELARELERNPDILKSVQEQIKRKKGIDFPNQKVMDPERRKSKIIEDLQVSPDKQYEPRTRSVRIREATQYVRTWLQNQYKNENGQMVCQICKEEMPFRKRDDEYYFEAVELFTKDIFHKEHEAQFLALCPLCAAMYKEFVKKDKAAMTDLRRALLNMDSLEFPLQLGDIEATIQFVETHRQDIKTILNQRAEDNE